MSKIITNSNKVSTVFLSDESPRDSVWDNHRSASQAVGGLYADEDKPRFTKLASRINECANYLGFNSQVDQATGEYSIKLKTARFCRVRTCPVCAWRRSLLWRARFFNKVLPILLGKEMTEYRFIFLTLTVKNCDVSNLRETLLGMNKAWQRMKDRDFFKKNIKGFIRATEVTRGSWIDTRTGIAIKKEKLHTVPRRYKKIKDTDTAHPHFHCLLLVSPSYFKGKNYISQAGWTEAWRKALQIDYNPIVNVKAVKPAFDMGFDEIEMPKDVRYKKFIGAVLETLKYAVKEADMTYDQDWLIKYTEQIHKLRFIATGGQLKDCLGEEPEEVTEADLLLQEENEESDPEKAEMIFRWLKEISRYGRDTQ
jgi:plasmid rolling circle replication initiator protein Rep